MSNDFCLNESTPDDEVLVMSNRLTVHFVTALGLSGTPLAATERQKLLLQDVLLCDQMVYGLGNTYLDVADMCWDVATLEADKAFMLRTLEGIRQRAGWDAAGMSFDMDALEPCIRRFADFVRQLALDDIDPVISSEWVASLREDPDEPINHGFPVCARHGVLHTRFGCYICNNYFDTSTSESE